MILKIKNRKIELILLLIAILQVLLLVNMVTAHSYIIHQTDSLIETKVIEEKNNLKNLINSGINLLIGFLSIKQIGTVSAQEGDWCCEELEESGAICQDISAGDEDLCDASGQRWMTDCQSTSLCTTGTCIDEEEGTCSVGTKKGCPNNWDGRSIAPPNNEIPECQFGCCTLDNGASKQFMRKIKCAKEDGSFDPSVSETNCRTYTQEMGACVLGEGYCKFTTQEDCETNLNGDDFRFGILCSNELLETNCNMPEEDEVRTTCYNDKVYFLDTCDELANVYDSDKVGVQDYWNIVQDTDCELTFGSDGFLEKTSQENCGNCDGMNSICGLASKEGVNPDYGDYVCKDLKCIDEKGNTRQNQEGWCIYESYLGESSDVVGSEHRVRWCDKGEIKYEVCGTYRGEICGERKIPLEGGEDVSIARCRFNEGFKGFALEFVPYEYNEDYDIINQDEVNEYKTKCGNLSDSRIQSVDLYGGTRESILQADRDRGTSISLGGNFLKFDFCVPKYPPGLEFWNSESNAKDICGVASLECPTLWVRSLIGDWYCEINCECLKKDFANQMNDFCISLGDCGGYVNVEGRYEKHFKTFDIDDLAKKYVTDYWGEEMYDSNGDIDTSKKTTYKGYAKNVSGGEPPQYFSSTEEGILGGDLEEIEQGEKQWSSIDTFYLTFYILGFGGTIVVLLANLGVASSVLGPIGWLVTSIIAFLIVLMQLLGVGETKEMMIEFECKPWQAPIGGEDCEKCDDDPLRPCTEYKCRSLGSGCRLIDEDELYESENPVCVYKYKNDVNPPQIKFESIDEDIYTVNEVNNGVEIRTSEGDGCIQEFTPLNFTLKTEENEEDDYARCVYNWESVSLDAPDYELTGEEFKEGNSWSITHTFEDRLPFVSSLDPADITGTTPGERTGELNMYVRCMDYAGNPNFNEYLVNLCIKEGPDNTIASIKEYIPKDESFLKYENTTQQLTINLDEPADCKWSHEADKSYDDMENNFSCLDFGSTGSCTTELTGLTASENKIYIKCKDQPWIYPGYDGPWDETNRNVNQNDFIYTLYATPTPLVITSISPQGDIIRGGSAQIDEDNLEVTTSGGMNNGVSTCEWKFIESPSNLNSWDFFAQENTYHKYPLHPQEGDYNILITCKDKAKNKAEGNAIFNLIVDKDAPIIVRAYKQGGSLKLITNEPAKCYYDFDRCYFDLESGTSMTTAFSTVHTTNWNPGVTYHIKCKDIFGNINTDPPCAKKIIPSA